MAKDYHPWTPTQSYLLPPSPLQWLPEGHLAYFVLDVVEQLDLSEIDDVIQERDGRGQRPYAPRMMTAVLLYAYCVGVFSSRRIERATHEDVAFRVLAANTHPHFTTINQFRLEHRKALSNLFLQVLQLCQRAGLVRLGRVAVDGTKVKANASKHKAMSHQRMKDEERRLRAEIEALLKRAEETDRAEDREFGAGARLEDLPSELVRREQRLKTIRSAREALEQEAAEARAASLRENADGQRKKAADPTVDADERERAARRAERSEEEARRLTGDDDDDPPSAADMPSHRLPAKPTGAPKPRAQRNFTDPDSRIMKSNGAFIQAFNAQIAVDEDWQVIVATGVSNQPPDQQHLVPMTERIIENCGEAPRQLVADSGYFTRRNVEHLAQRGIDGYIAVARKDLAQPRKPKTLHLRARKAMHEKLSSAQGREAYARRKVIAEPPLGQIKAARGFRSFLLRGLSAVRHEWSLVCATHNLLKLFRAHRLATATA